VRDEIAKFAAARMQPLGVNPASVDSHRSYVEKMRFNFPLLSDPERSIAGAYHALRTTAKEFSGPSTDRPGRNDPVRAARRPPRGRHRRCPLTCMARSPSSRASVASAKSAMR